MQTTHEVQLLRFLAKTRTAENGCLEWIGGLDVYGYGRFWVDGKRMSAHRAAYFLQIGKIPEGFCVCHSCDNRKCVNVDHLWLGSMADNVKDMDLKNRRNVPSGDLHYTRTHPEKSIRGEGHPSAKLTTYAVQSIRFAKSVTGAASHDLARVFGINSRTIRKIVANKAWKHVTA